MRTIIYNVILLLSGLFFAASGSRAGEVYLRSDERGRMHVTDEPPTEGGRVRDMLEANTQ